MPEAKSFSGRNWTVKRESPQRVAALKTAGLPLFAARIAASRGIAPDQLDKFIDPKLMNLCPDPSTFKDMDKACERLARAIVDRQRIGIWSDYDCDGATSAAVLIRYLRMVGHRDTVLRIPDRLTEGYGPNTPGMLWMKEQGCDLVCSLDAGIVAYEPLAAADAAGMEVIVIDHHLPSDGAPTKKITAENGEVSEITLPHQNPEYPIPLAYAVVNPNRKDDTSGQGYLCAAGVTFMTCMGIHRILNKMGYFSGLEGRPAKPPELMLLLDAVAVGTVGDVVPLVGLNRAFVRQGCKILSMRGNPGLAALAAVSGINEKAQIGETECGWRLAPRINAGGRIASSMLGAELLIEEDPVRAKERAEELDRINSERKSIEEDGRMLALHGLDGTREQGDTSIVISVVPAHEGVVGIIAGRLKELYLAPAIVLTEDHDGNLKGSARSMPGFDIGHAIIDAQKAGLLIKGGGHGMAGGLTLRPEVLEDFRAFMNAEIAKSEFAKVGAVTDIDLEARLVEISEGDVASLSVLRPFGTNNPEPTILLKGLQLCEIKVMKERHFKLIMRDGNRQIDVLKMGIEGTELAEKIRAAQGAKVDVLGRVSINEWNNRRSIQMDLDDMRLSM